MNFVTFPMSQGRIEPDAATLHEALREFQGRGSISGQDERTRMQLPTRLKREAAVEQERHT